MSGKSKNHLDAQIGVNKETEKKSKIKTDNQPEKPKLWFIKNAHDYICLTV